MTSADIFIKKGASVSMLGDLYRYLEEAFADKGLLRILCCAGVIVITIDAGVYISNGEIREAAKDLGWIISDIVRRQCE